jgi:hypothetical protein
MFCMPKSASKQALLWFQNQRNATNGANHPSPGMTPSRIISADHAGMQAFQISPGDIRMCALDLFSKKNGSKIESADERRLSKNLDFLEQAGSEKQKRQIRFLEPIPGQMCPGFAHS